MRQNSAQTRRDKQITREIHRLFWRSNWQHKWSLIICYLMAIPSFGMVYVVIPLYTAYGVEALIEGRSNDVRRYAWLIVLFSLIYSIAWIIRTFTASYNGSQAGAYLQNQVFSNYLDKDYDFYTSTYFGSLGAQATRLREALNHEYNLVVTLQIPKQVIIVGGGILVIAMHSLLLAVITVFAMLFVLGWTLFSSTWRLKYRRQVGEASSEVAGKIGDALTQASTVISFANEDYESHRLNKDIQVWRRAQFRSWLASLPADVGRMVLAAITTAVLLIATSGLYQDGQISIAIVTLVQLYVIRLVASTSEIAETIKLYEAGMGSAYQPVKTMLIESEIQDPAVPSALPASDQYGINFKNVKFSYPSAKAGNEAVSNFNLSIAPGEKIGLVGYSGSGKTTLTKLLMRFMDATTGSIEISGIDIRQTRQKELRQKIAYVPQEPALFHRSIHENIAYGKPGASPKQIQQAAKLAYVDEFAEELPHELETLVGERGIKLSGGQRQRVAIARAILKDSPVLVLDEATSALDSKSEQLIQKALWELMKDRTALVIAHRLSTIQRMDRIVVMDKGKIVQTGTHEELLKDKNGIYAELWAHQSGGYIGVPASTE